MNEKPRPLQLTMAGKMRETYVAERSTSVSGVVSRLSRLFRLQLIRLRRVRVGEKPGGVAARETALTNHEDGVG